MNIKQLTGVILVGVTGLVTLGMVACDGDNAISGNLLKKPTLSGTYDYEHPSTPSGNSLSIKDLLLSRAFKSTIGFPGSGNIDPDMQEASSTFSNASATLGRGTVLRQADEFE